MSMLSAYCVYEEKLKDRFEPTDISVERIYYTRTVEYFIENAIYRYFSILEKLAHSINVLMQFKLSEREVSFAKVRTLLNENYQDNLLTNEVNSFEANTEVLKTLRETRNATTHRKDPLAPTFVMEDLELDGPVDEGPEKLIAQIFNVGEAPIDIDKLYSSTEEFYFVLTDFIKNILLIELEMLHKRFEQEQDHYNSHHTCEDE